MKDTYLPSKKLEQQNRLKNSLPALQIQYAPNFSVLNVERRVIATLNCDIQHIVKTSSNVFQTNESNKWHSLKRSEIYSVN